jgi:cytochrome c biogenesis protein CcmG, thiol:disulfide interchange protein DsbE
MNPQYLKLLPLGLLFLFALVISLGLFGTGKPPEIKSRMVGQYPGVFDLTVLDMPQAHFSPQYWRGRVVVLNTFASWCEPCLLEHPLLMKLAQTRKAEMLGISWKDKPDDTRKWLQSRGNPFSQVGVDILGQTTVHLGLTGVPETLILDKRGVIVYHRKAQLTETEVSQVIIPLLDQLNGHATPAPAGR